MRPYSGLRKSRPVHVAAGALILAIPASAVALSANQAEAQSAIQINLSPRHVGFGHEVTVTGTAASAAGQTLELEFAPAGGWQWRPLTSTRVRPDGSFRMVAPLKRSGLVRVQAAPSAAQATPAPIPGSTTPTANAPSVSQQVAVASQLRVAGTGARDVLGGQSIDVRGRLLPAVAGRRLRLQGRSGGRWNTLASARTGKWGGFDLRYTPGNTGQQQLRVRFAGDRLNTRSSTGAGRLTVYQQSVASWYNDAGSTACGFHAYFGVANRDLPCGTTVTFHYGGRSVTAVVDDRGPFVGGRDWDLNQNTAAALGFSGVDTVWTSF